MKEYSYARVEDINFKSARKLKEDLDASIENIGEGLCSSTPKAAAPPERKSKAVKEPSPPSVNEMNYFYKPLNCCKIKLVALSLVNPYAEDFLLKSRDILAVSDLFDKKDLTFQYHELLKACTDISINFKSARKLEEDLDASVENIGEGLCSGTPKAAAPPEPKSKAVNEPSPPSVNEMNDFYKPLNCCKIKLVALSLVNPYAEDFLLKSRDILTVSDLFDKKDLTFQYHELLKACTDISINIIERDIKLTEQDTRKQSKSASIYHHRAGRIGASINNLACHTNPAQPSQSLIKKICYPNLSNLVQLPQSMDASMKTKSLRLLRTL